MCKLTNFALNLGLEKLTAFLDIFDIWLLLCSGRCSILYTIISVFNAMPSEGKKGISPDSQNLLMISWTVDGEIPVFLAILCWETEMLRNYLLVKLLACKEWSPFYSQIMILSPDTNQLFTCGTCQTGVFF